MLTAWYIFLTLYSYALFDRSQEICLFRSYRTLCSLPFKADNDDDDDYHDGDNENNEDDEVDNYDEDETIRR